jgi:hypothetical protein
MPPLYWLIAKCALVFLFFAWLANAYWPLGLLGLVLPFWMWRQYLHGRR